MNQSAIAIPAISSSVVLIVSLVAPLALMPFLRRLDVIDVPNERSSHTRPVIRGMGLAPLLAVVVGCLIVLGGTRDTSDLVVFAVILGVSLSSALLGWIEDVHGLPIRVRAVAQVLIGLVGSGIALRSNSDLWWLLPIFALAIAGYINVANFMDGINGISGLHGAVVGVTYAALGVLVGAPWLTMAGCILAAAFIGFLPWNLIRGGVFLGDVGSYLLGASIAIIAVTAVARGVPVIAAIAPLAIYLTDTGVTLARRIARRERWYQAHRSHVYQRMTDIGLSHGQVACIVAVASLAAGGAGLLVAIAPSLSFTGTISLVIILAGYLALGPTITASRSHRNATQFKGYVK